jgi:hypothetical protein
VSVTDPTDPNDSLPHISDRYVIHEKLGVGGAGTVYRALDRSCDAEIAIKLLRADLAEQETHRLRFLREFRAVSRLDHPGCLIHFLWAGAPPFPESDNQFQILRAHLEVLPPPLRARAPEAPLALEELTARLLAGDPAHRPQSAQEVVNVVAELLEGIDGSDGLPTERTLGRAFIYRPPFVGRERERARLTGWIEDMQRGGGPALVGLCGAAGIGKSRLIDQLHADLMAREERILVATVPELVGEPFAPFPDLERRVASQLGDGPPPSDPDAATDSWSVVDAPVIGSVTVGSGENTWTFGASAHSPAARDPEAARRARAGILAQRLIRLARERPTLVILEDLHFIKPGGMAFLRELLAALEATEGRCPGLMVTLRPGAAREQLEALPARHRLAWIDLQPLAREHIVEMLTRMMGNAWDGSDVLVDRMIAETEGNPLFVQACLLAFVDEGKLVRSPTGWTLAGSSDELSLPIIDEIIVPLGAVRASHDNAHRIFERG